MARKEKKAPEGAPEWMVTYGDMMTLLLCFFVLLVAMSEIKQEEKFRQVVDSLRHAFGYESSLETAPGDVDPLNAMMRELQAIVIPPHRTYQGDAEDQGIDGRVQKVTDVRDGLQIVVGGRVAFERFSAVLRPEAEERIVRVADKIKGKNTKVVVRGHATSEPLPDDSLYAGPMELSFARAQAVAEALHRGGVRKPRIVIEANGDHEPINSQAYTEERRAVNRRVEIIVTEALLQDYAGKPMTGEQEEPPDA